MTIYDNKESWWNKITSYFQGYPQWLVEGGFALIIGLFVGFIAKNFGKALVYAFIVLVIASYVMNYLGLVDFHYDKIKALFGITEIPAMDVAIANLWQWMKEHVALCIGAGLGFVLGWRLGS